MNNLTHESVYKVTRQLLDHDKYVAALYEVVVGATYCRKCGKDEVNLKIEAHYYCREVIGPKSNIYFTVYCSSCSLMGESGMMSPVLAVADWNHKQRKETLQMLEERKKDDNLCNL